MQKYKIQNFKHLKFKVQKYKCVNWKAWETSRADDYKLPPQNRLLPQKGVTDPHNVVRFSAQVHYFAFFLALLLNMYSWLRVRLESLFHLLLFRFHTEKDTTENEIVKHRTLIVGHQLTKNERSVLHFKSIWDSQMSVFFAWKPLFSGHVCGLIMPYCLNFDLSK